MPKIRPGPGFEKAFVRLAGRDLPRRRRILNALTQFEADPRRVGLNFERLKGTDFFSIRVTQGDRVILRQIDADTFELVDVGSHDIYRRYG